MNHLFIALVLASTGTAVAAGSKPEFEALKATAEEQMAHSASYYNDVVHPQFYESVMSQCVKASLSDERPFEMIIEIGRSGQVAHVVFNNETAVTRCLFDILRATKFKSPQISRYLAHFAIRFGK